MKILQGGALLLGLTLLAGCTGQAPQAVSTDPQTSAEETALWVLKKVYTADAQDSAEFEEALLASTTAETALDDYLAGRVGDKFTAEGRDTLLANRVVTRVLNTWPSTEVSVETIELSDPLDQTDTSQRYTYTVTAAPEDTDPETYTGELSLTLTDGVWQVNSIQ